MLCDTADKADTKLSEYTLRIELFVPSQWNPHPWSWLPVTIPTSLPSLVLSEPLNYLYANVHTALERWRGFEMFKTWAVVTLTFWCIGYCNL